VPCTILYNLNKHCSVAARWCADKTSSPIHGLPPAISDRDLAVIVSFNNRPIRSAIAVQEQMSKDHWTSSIFSYLCLQGMAVSSPRLSFDPSFLVKASFV